MDRPCHFNKLRNSKIKNAIGAYSREDVGFGHALEPHVEYNCKLRRDLEQWCFTTSQRQQFDSVYLWDFARLWAWAMGPKIYLTPTKEAVILGERFHDEDHISFAVAMFFFYSNYSSTI